MVGTARFTQGILPCALRAALHAFKFAPGEFVNLMASSNFPAPQTGLRIALSVKRAAARGSIKTY
jgi:hypothetical protein